MNQDQLVSVVDNLETFIQLKNQNLLIYSWIQLKKQGKTYSLSSHFRNRSISENFRNVQPYQTPHLGPFGTQPLIRPPPLEANDLNRLKTQRFANELQNITAKEELFQTFNKSKDINRFSVPENEIYQYEPSQRLNFQTKYYQEDDENDQFEDIVLDRLSKLQENINKLMEEKRNKEESRGYVGTPLTYKQYEHSYDENEQELDQDSIKQSQVSEKKSNKYRQPYESWQASPIGGCNNDVIYNFKYIPMIKKQSVNIYKIRELIDNNREAQNEHLNNYQAGNSGKYKQKLEKLLLNGNDANKNTYKPLVSDRKSGDPSREVGSSTLYINRYEGNKSVKNSNQVHFVPKNIEMQTVIEPRSKYSRNNSNKNIAVRGKEQNGNNERKLKLKAKVSNSSSESYFSSHSEAANNRSALY